MFFDKDYSNLKSIFELPVVDFFGNILSNIKFKNGTETREFDGNATFLIPCYKKSHFIEDAVKSCLNQSIPADVIVLLMDEDSYAKKDILEKNNRVKCICSERMNVVKAREYLVSQCKTDWFIFLDGDDLISSNYIEVLSKKDGAIRFGGMGTSLDDEKTFSPLDRFGSDEISNILCYNNTSLMHKDVFYDIGYDETLCNGGEDTDFNARLIFKKYWKISYDKTAFYVYQRETENQLTRNWKVFSDSIIKAYAKNTPVWKDGMSGLVQSGEKLRAVRWVLEDFTEDRILTFFYFNQIGTNNYKSVFDKYVSKEYQKRLLQSQKSDNETLELQGGRVYSFEDIIEKESLLPDKVKEETEDLEPGSKLFYVLDKYKCIETDSPNNRPIKKVDNTEWLTYAEQVKSIPDIQNFIHTLKKSYELNNLPDDPYIQKTSFLFNKTCNASCNYCYQDKSKETVGDDELYERFDRYLTKLEKITNNNIYPQILGGEPTLFSDYLINKIVERLKDYKEFCLFSNCIKKESIWYSVPNILINHHIINWTTTKQENLIAKRNVVYSIVVTKPEIPCLESFLQEADGFNLIVNPCFSINDKYNTSIEDKQKIYNIAKKYNRAAVVLKSFKKLDAVPNAQKRCRVNSGVWEVDLVKETIAPCCGNRTLFSLDEFDGTQKETDCGDCFNFGNMA